MVGTMSRRVQFILIIMVLFTSPILASAQNPYGLVWGVSVGDEFHYQVDFVVNSTNNPPQSISEELIATVEEINDLSDYTNPDYFPAPAQINVTYANRTELTYEDLIYSVTQQILILPIGNWTHYNYVFEISEPTQPDQTSVTVYEDWITWSVESASWSELYMYNYTFHISKSDGVLNSLSMNLVNQYIEEGEVLFRHETIVQLTRLGLDTSILIPTISAVVVIVEIIVVIEIVRRYKGRKMSEELTPIYSLPLK